MGGKARERYENYKQQPVEMVFKPSFTGKLSQYGLNPDARKITKNTKRTEEVKKKIQK